MEGAQLALAVELGLDDAGVDEVGAVAEPLVVLGQEELRERARLAVGEGVEVEREDGRVALREPLERALDRRAARGVGRDPGGEALGGRGAGEDAVLGEQGGDLGEVRLARAEVAGDPGADLGLALLECVGVELEEVVEVSLDHRRNDVAADLPRQLGLVAGLADLDDGLDLVFDSGLEQLADMHRGSRAG